MQTHVISPEELAKLLASVRVEDVAREAGVSTKTVYRLRHQQHSPTLETLRRIVDAAKRLKTA